MYVPKRVLIIGGGPAGLISYRNLGIFGDFGHVELYERRDDVGGVWYLDNPPEGWKGPRWPSPAYPNFVSNTLPEFTSFSHFPLPNRLDPDQPFLTVEEVHEFLRVFAQPYLESNKMKLNMEVTRIEELPNGKGWRVLTRDWNQDKDGGEVESLWDAVVLAVGWGDNPVWPQTEGLDLLRDNGLAVHAQQYRGPHGNEGKRVLIVGNAASSNDIAAQVAPLAKAPVYQSIRRPAFPGFPSLPDERIVMVAPVSKYELDHDTNKITAYLADGQVLDDIDIVHIGAGYKPYVPFVHVLNPDRSEGEMERKLVPLCSLDPIPELGPRIPRLHRHIVYAHNPSLAFIGSCMSFTPFTIADVSSLWLTYVWRGDIPLPALSFVPRPPDSAEDETPGTEGDADEDDDCDADEDDDCDANTVSSSIGESDPTFLPPNTPNPLLEYESSRLESIRNWLSQLPSSSSPFDPSNPPPSSFYAYSVLGYGEEDYAKSLRQEIVKVREDWDRALPKWDEEGKQRREAMYQRKLEVLEWARDHSS